MSRSIKQLREDLAGLGLNVTNLASELEEIYINYLKSLGDSVARQLILAGYQICTQKYPQSFLNLTFDQRSKLQQNLKKISSIFNQQLNEHLSTINPKNLESIPNIQEVLLKEKDEEKSELESIKIEKSLDKASDEALINPDELIRLYLNLEHNIHQTLNDLSRLANNYLQKVKILPNKLPLKVLDMALQAEERGSVMSGSPNLINLLIEKESKEEEQQKDIASITAIRLHLSEIEFSDPTLNSYRNQIRSILAKLENLREQYHKKKQEYTIAEAESAWRSSWFD